MTRGRNDGSAGTIWKKILIISLVFLVVLAVAIYISIINSERSSIIIQFSNGREIIVSTSKTKVSEVLIENNIIIASNEEVFPTWDSEIRDGDTIKITLAGNTFNNSSKNNTDRTEATVRLLEEVPFEILLEDVSNGASNVINTITQYGRMGLKEVTYKITYEGDIEIGREELSSRIVRESVSHIIQTQERTVISSGNTNPSTSSRADVTSLLPDKYIITAYCSCSICCGPYSPENGGRGTTASGTVPVANHTIAAPSIFEFGTQIRINGIVYTVEDRGGAIQGNRLDIYMDTHQAALLWGVRVLSVEILYDIYGI